MAANFGGVRPASPAGGDVPPPAYAEDPFDPMEVPPDYTNEPRRVAQGALGPPGPEFPNISPNEMQFRTQAWLHSGQAWNPELQRGYEGVCILNMGDSVIGLWEQVASADERRRIAVKQTRRERNPAVSLDNESDLYNQMRHPSTKHVLRLLKGIRQDIGKNTLPQDVGIVSRIFLEYAPGGSLLDWQHLRIARRIRPTEMEMWEIFHCLSRGLLIMHHGDEDPDPDRSSSDLGIIHYDLNQSSVLIADPVQDEEHRGAARVFKLSSFRRAQKVRARQDGAYHDRYCDFGPVNSMAPEQLRSERMGRSTRPWLKNRRINHRSRHGNIVDSIHLGPPINVWKAGLIMYCLATNVTEVAWEDMQLFRADKTTTRLANGGPSLGTINDREQAKGNRPRLYSRHLMSTIRECLLVQSAERPRPSDLFRKTKNALLFIQSGSPPHELQHLRGRPGPPEPPSRRAPPPPPRSPPPAYGQDQPPELAWDLPPRVPRRPVGGGPVVRQAPVDQPIGLGIQGIQVEQFPPLGPALNLPIGLQPGPPDPNLINTIRALSADSTLVCNILEGENPRRWRGTVYLTDLLPDETMFEIKVKLVREDVGIDIRDMRFRNTFFEDTVLGDNVERSELGPLASILVDNANQMEIGEGGGFQF